MIESSGPFFSFDQVSTKGFDGPVQSLIILLIYNFQNYVTQGQEVTQTGSGSSAGAIGGKLHAAEAVKKLSNEEIASYIKVSKSGLAFQLIQF